MRYLLVLAVLAACASTPASSSRARATTGGIAGLARDHDSGDPVATAEVRVGPAAPATGPATATASAKPHVTTSSDRGLYDIQNLAPGRYAMRATFAGQPIDVTNIDVRAGEITMVDLVFTLGRPDPIVIDHSVLQGSEIARYRPQQLTATQVLIEGTITDIGTRQRVSGAVVTAVRASSTETAQHTVSDDQGRYRFEAMPPGTYAISAYYSVGGRGQIEVRRSGIEVAGAEAVHVPLWIEMQR
ncbi:MAG: carboxypeptidase-like regulatory domain-containing protein [Myxococcota bacterium]|nr:carboxypeptidase-like regulatory domain-containing protein [Myxococcota bacterium]